MIGGTVSMQTAYRTAVLALTLAAGAARSEPYIAVRTGFKCSVCHVNGTGGGKRTDFGNVYTQSRLLMASPLSQGMPLSFDPKLNNTVSVGANWRVEQVRRQEYRYGAVSAPSSDEPVIRESNLYVNIELLKGFLSAYIDETLAPTAMNREFHATVKLPGNSWFKFGRTLLPYGFRLMDDDAFVRNGTNYTYNRHDLAYEAGFEPGPLSLVANVTRDQLSTVGSLVFKDMPVVRTFRSGASYGTATKKLQRDKQNTYGVFGGFALGMFTVLGERDWIKNDTVLSIADYVEADFLPVQGLNFKLVYEYLWPDKAVPRANNGRRRLTVGAEPFLTQFLQAGLYWRQNEWIPQNAEKNQDEIFGRLHVFF
jgi:hypothetical protein